jgi:hypothetical protein
MNYKMNLLKITAILSISLLSFLTRVSAQHRVLDTLVTKFQSYQKNTLDEKLFVHTDRSTYFIGESIWFKIYYVDAALHHPLHVSKVAYLELIDKDKFVVLQSKIELNGNGNGSLFLPASINSGNYLLRVYTHWMKNFGTDNFYQQELKIINPFSGLEKKATAAAPQYDAQFFPEGGNLVRGLRSKIAFRVVDQNGKGINFKGAIVNEKSDTLLSFSPLQFGLGHFFLTPTDVHYKAIINDLNGHQFIYNLPRINEEGYVLTLMDSATMPSLMVSVNARFNDLSAGKPVSIIAHTRKKIIASATQIVTAAGTSFLIDKKLLGDGVTHITMFNEDLVPVCERLYFTKPSDKLKIDLTPDQSQYTLRKKVNLKIYAHSDGAPVSSDLSIAVFRLDSLQDDRTNIKDYLLLTSELNGRVESAGYYFSDSVKNIAVDNLMLTHGWSRFKWTDVLRPTKKFDFMPEVQGHVINGVVTNESGAPARGIATYLSTPNKVVRVYASKSTVDGKVKFEMKNFYDGNEIIAQTNILQDSTYKIQIINPYAEAVSNYKLSAFGLDENLKEKILQRSIHMQVQNAFYETQINSVLQPAVDSTAFYGKPNEKYLLDDYTRFPTMEEVMREYVPGVMVRKRKNKFYFINFDTPNKSLFNDDPLVLLDGMPVFDADKIMKFDPRKIKSLDVITQRYFLGALSFDGIVSYQTYSGDLGGFQPDPKSLIIPYDGLQLQREFFTPRYESQQQRVDKMPDARHLLYWSPSVKTNNLGKGQLEFYTSDITGNYKVVIQGITKTGEPGYTSFTFEVKDAANY